MKPEKNDKIIVNDVEMWVTEVADVPGPFPSLTVKLSTEAPQLDKPPPLGIKPLYLHNYDRLIELLDTCERYVNDNKQCDPLWIQEIRDLIKTRHVVNQEARLCL